MNIINAITASIFQQKAQQQAHENQLAAYTSTFFVDRLRPVLKDLSEHTGRTYNSYLIEAQDRIIQGESETDTYDYFRMKLCRANHFYGG